MKFFHRCIRFCRRLGPGLITGAADDDPSGIATYSQTGAQFGYSQLWTALFSFPFMTVIQEMCGRIGLVTGRGLAALIRDHYPRPILYFCVLLLLIANTVNIGADLGAMAAAGRLLWDIPFVAWLAGITVLTLVLEIFVTYTTYARFLKYLTFALLAYVITAFLVKHDWRAVGLATIIPRITLSREYFLNIVAILGTTISPYLFFWQTNEEVEELIEKHKLQDPEHGKPKINLGDISAMRKDTGAGMLVSNAIMFFIILTTAATLGTHGIKNVNTAAQAAEALRPLAGDFTFLLFTAGVLGTGLLAVPVLAASASYAVAETFDWESGLYKKFAQAHKFYGIIAITVLVGLLVNFTSLPPFKLLYYTAVLNGVISPPLMIMIMLIANKEPIMGRFTNSRRSNILGWLITVIMAVCALALVIFPG